MYFLFPILIYCELNFKLKKWKLLEVTVIKVNSFIVI